MASRSMLGARTLRRLGMAAQNALEIIRAGRLTTPSCAPHEIASRGRIHSLRRYVAKGRQTGPRSPLLLVPPLMVTAEVYDIAPDISAIGMLAGQGIDVWLIDFGAPEHSRGGMQRTLDDHVHAVNEAIEHVRAQTGQSVHLAGYSQGGMFAYQVAALRRGEGLASVITFGSPVDLRRALPTVDDAFAETLITWLRLLIARPLEHLGGIPALLSTNAFKLLNVRKELGQLVDFLVKLHDRAALEKREFKRLFLGGEGFVAWPGPALRTFIDEVIVQNRMTTGGFILDGRTVTLADIRCPILCFVGERDDLARPASVRAIAEASPHAELYIVDVKAGHFGLVVGSTALLVTWTTVAEWLRWREGLADRPRALPNSDPPTDDHLELALRNVQLDFELAVDVAQNALSDVWQRLQGGVTELLESLEDLRTQAPRLARLRAIDAGTRISAGLELALRAKEVPNQTFFLWRERAFSYADADTRVDNVTRGLIACGITLGQRVGVMMNGRPSLLSLITAISRLGAVAVLLNPRLDLHGLRAALALGEVAVLICDPDTAAAGRQSFAGQVLALGGGPVRELPADVLDMEAIEPSAVALPAWYRPNPGRAGELALVIMTGRSGNLRASHVTNGRWATSALGAAAACTLTPRDTVYSCLPLHHATGIMVAAGSAIVSGARLAMEPDFQPRKFWDQARRYGATVVFYAGDMARELILEPARPGQRNHPVRLFAGSGMQARVWQRLVERFGSGVLEFYATTEISAVLANASGEKIGSVGRPLPGSAPVELLAMDFVRGGYRRNEHGRLLRCADDEVGVLVAAVATDEPPPGIHEQRLLRGVFAADDVWLVTDDLLRRDADGDFWFVARIADLLPTAAGWVAPQPIEDALYRIPGIEFAVAHAVTVDGIVMPMATVVCAMASLNAEALGDAVAALPEHARPRFVRRLEAMPMTEGFRPDKQALRSAGVGPGDKRLLRYDNGRYQAHSRTQDSSS